MSPALGDLCIASMGRLCLFSVKEGFCYEVLILKEGQGLFRTGSFVGLLTEFFQDHKVLCCAVLAGGSIKRGTLLHERRADCGLHALNKEELPW